MILSCGDLFKKFKIDDVELFILGKECLRIKYFDTFLFVFYFYK